MILTIAVFEETYDAQGHEYDADRDEQEAVNRMKPGGGLTGHQPQVQGGVSRSDQQVPQVQGGRHLYVHGLRGQGYATFMWTSSVSLLQSSRGSKVSSSPSSSVKAPTAFSASSVSEKTSLEEKESATKTFIVIFCHFIDVSC